MSVRATGAAALGVVGLLLAGCGGGGTDEAASPRLGGPATQSASPPGTTMDALEESVRSRLGDQLSDEGLELGHVDCPQWGERVPAVLRCEGYVEGVVGSIVVELDEARADEVEFDAELEGGVVATTRLVEQLAGAGYARVDCGPTAAYPARQGLRIVCRVRRDGRTDHVVATVADRTGRVRIEDY